MQKSPETDKDNNRKVFVVSVRGEFVKHKVLRMGLRKPVYNLSQNTKKFQIEFAAKMNIEKIYAIQQCETSNNPRNPCNRSKHDL